MQLPLRNSSSLISDVAHIPVVAVPIWVHRQVGSDFYEHVVIWLHVKPFRYMYVCVILEIVHIILEIVWPSAVSSGYVVTLNLFLVWIPQWGSRRWSMLRHTQHVTRSSRNRIRIKDLKNVEHIAPLLYDPSCSQQACVLHSNIWSTTMTFKKWLEERHGSLYGFLSGLGYALHNV